MSRRSDAVGDGRVENGDGGAAAVGDADWLARGGHRRFYRSALYAPYLACHAARSLGLHGGKSDGIMHAQKRSGSGSGGPGYRDAAARDGSGSGRDPFRRNVERCSRRTGHQRHDRDVRVAAGCAHLRRTRPRGDEARRQRGAGAGGRRRATKPVRLRPRLVARRQPDRVGVERTGLDRQGRRHRPAAPGRRLREPSRVVTGRRHPGRQIDCRTGLLSVPGAPSPGSATASTASVGASFSPDGSRFSTVATRTATTTRSAGASTASMSRTGRWTPATPTRICEVSRRTTGWPRSPAAAEWHPSQDLILVAMDDGSEGGNVPPHRPDGSAGTTPTCSRCPHRPTAR